MKSFRFGLAALAFSVLMPASPASGASESTASCEATWRKSMSPGVTSTPQTVTFTTHGETGTITCVGAVNGHEVTGPGSLGLEGIFEGTCLSGRGIEAVSVTIPTSGGPQKLTFPATVTTGPGVGSKSSDSLMGPFAMAFRPVAGDCATTPATEVDFTGQGILKS